MIIFIAVVLFFNFYTFNAMKLEIDDKDSQIDYWQQSFNMCPLTFREACDWYQKIMMSNGANIEFIVAAAERIFDIEKKEKDCVKKSKEFYKNILNVCNNPQWSKDKELVEQEFFPL